MQKKCNKSFINKSSWVKDIFIKLLFCSFLNDTISIHLPVQEHLVTLVSQYKS